MPLSPNNPLLDVLVNAFNAVGGTPAGSKVTMMAPVRGRIIEVGYVPNSVVTSAISLAVLVGNNQTSSAASNFTTVVTSTLGTFSSTNLYEGACASVIPASPVYVNQGDAIQWVCSGGQSSTFGTNCYAIIRRS